MAASDVNSIDFLPSPLSALVFGRSARVVGSVPVDGLGRLTDWVPPARWPAR